MESGNLRKMMGKDEVSKTQGKTGNYNKRAIPFDRDDEVHMAGLEAICEAFADPWNTGRQYSRSDLATDVGDFFVNIQSGNIVPIPRELFDAACKPYLAEQAKASKAAAAAKAKAKAKAKPK